MKKPKFKTPDPSNLKEGNVFRRFWPNVFPDDEPVIRPIEVSPLDHQYIKGAQQAWDDLFKNISYNVKGPFISEADAKRILNDVGIPNALKGLAENSPLALWEMVQAAIAQTSAQKYQNPAQILGEATRIDPEAFKKIEDRKSTVNLDFNPHSIDSWRSAILKRPIAETMFETVSFHIVKPCNMKCKFCYATFDDMHVGPQMSLNDAQTIVSKLKAAGMEKITFAGGEPMLYKYIDEIIRFSKKIGLTTSIISNGSLMTGEWLRKMRPYLDWIGVSIDSTNMVTNEKIGRITSRPPVSPYHLVDVIQGLGYKLKINTVVNAYNWNENMNAFIKFANPDRWKVFQALRIEGQNDQQFDEMKVTTEQWGQFLSNHKNQKSLVPEDNQSMTGSYLLVDPLGRFFENSSGKYTYSEPLTKVSLSEALKQINLDRDMFIKRGGLYKW